MPGQQASVVGHGEVAQRGGEFVVVGQFARQPGSLPQQWRCRLVVAVV
jgi:hypothetical protein